MHFIFKRFCNGYKYSKCTSPVAAAAAAAQFKTVDVEYIGMHDNNIDYFKNNKLINTNKLLKNLVTFCQLITSIIFSTIPYAEIYMLVVLII